MKIYPKIRKYQSGGQLSDVNFYPTVQYTPTSNVAITQGAWSPLKQTVTPDATIDPELLKKIGGLTNENAAVMQEMNSNLHAFNSLNEAEKKSNRGINLWNSIKGNTALVTELANNKERNDKALAKADASGAFGTLAVDRNGNVATTMPNGEVQYISPSEFVSNIGKVKGNTVKELATLRGNSPLELFNKGVIHDDVISQLTGRDVQLENLSKIASKIGTTEVNSKIQNDFEFDKDDSTLKTYTIGRGTLSNGKQIAVAAELASRVMSQEDKNSIKATALQKLVDNDNTPLYKDNGKGGKEFVPSGDYFSYRKWNSSTKKMETGKVYYSEIRNNIDKLNEQEQAETDPDKKQRIRNIKANIVNNFQKEYLSSFVQEYFDAQRQNKDDIASTFSVADQNTLDNFAGGAYKKTPATSDVKAFEGHITSHMDDVAVTSDGTLFGTVHSSKVTKLAVTNNPVSSNITVGDNKQPIILNDFNNDPKANLFVNNTETIRGIAKSKYSEDTQKNMFRVGSGEATHTYFMKDNEGKFFNITGETVVKGSNPPKKTLDYINENKEKIKEKVIKEKGTDDDFNTQFKQWLKSQKMINPPSPLFKMVVLVPIDSKNTYDQRLLKGESGFEESLSEQEKLATMNRLTTLNNEKNPKNGKLNDFIFSTKNEITLNSKTYKVVVREMTGLATSYAMINDLSKGYGQEADLTYNGNIETIDQQRQTTLDELLESVVGYQKEEGGELPTLEEGGILTRFTPQEFKIKPLSLKDLY